MCMQMGVSVNIRDSDSSKPDVIVAPEQVTGPVTKGRKVRRQQYHAFLPWLIGSQICSHVDASYVVSMNYYLLGGYFGGHQ